MNLLQFGSAGELNDYVTDNTIAQAKIVTIIEKDGQWYLFWYT